MFIVDEETRQITLHKGDTGEITFTINGYDFSSLNLRCVFSMKQSGVEVKEEIHELDENNQFTVEFINTDTDYLTPGSYEYDVTVVVDPVFDGTGKIIDGSVVRTLCDPIPVTIKRTVRNI